jgi:hypothetical protein
VLSIALFDCQRVYFLGGHYPVSTSFNDGWYRLILLNPGLIFPVKHPALHPVMPLPSFKKRGHHDILCPWAVLGCPGRVDFQLVRNFLGGFIQMRRVLCDPAGWRDMMKAYLEKLGSANVNSGNIRLAGKSSEIPIFSVVCRTIYL